MKRSDFLRKIARAYDNCDGVSEKLMEDLICLECIGTNRGVTKELLMAADALDRLEQIETESNKNDKG